MCEAEIECCDNCGAKIDGEECLYCKVITVLDLAKFRGIDSVKLENDDGYSMADFALVGLPMLGGCYKCGATIAAYNAAPTTNGYLACAKSCAVDIGYSSVEDANHALFPEEYVWKGAQSKY